MHQKSERTIFFVSDGTGITIETLGQSLLTQFPAIIFHQHIYPFIKSKDLAQQTVTKIQRKTQESGHPPLLFISITDPDVRAVFSQPGLEVIDLFSQFLPQLEKALHAKSVPTLGEAHGIGAPSDYQRRISALNYTLDHDDGLRTQTLKDADIILTGVSRSGKTPTCLYLAMHYLLKAANYPLTDDDFEYPGLPPAIVEFKDKLFGLTIEPNQLARIREERRPNSKYASIDQCKREVRWAERLFCDFNISHINTSTVSIEEIATTAFQHLGLNTTGKW